MQMSNHLKYNNGLKEKTNQKERMNKESPSIRNFNKTRF